MGPSAETPLPDSAAAGGAADDTDEHTPGAELGGAYIRSSIGTISVGIRRDSDILFDKKTSSCWG